MGAEEILKQNLAIEPDVQNFIDFVLKSVAALEGSQFSASLSLLGLLDALRRSGAGTGQPLSVRLLLQGRRLIAQWGEMESFCIAEFLQRPVPEKIAELRTWLSNSVALVDPEILQQRNREMMRHLHETRVKAERELADLQRNLLERQRELLESTLQAQTDALTGLYNRRAFDERLKRAFLHTMRQKNSPLSLMLFDLDHFKEINDEFGHQYGDAYLNKMAVVLREIIREDVDMAFRFGGDEFAVVLFADPTIACAKAKLVLKLMEGRVSIGIASIDRDTPDRFTLQDFIHRADAALYEAKHRGRGQAVIDACALQSGGACQPSCSGMAA